MPSRRLHNIFNQILTGDTGNNINYIKDLPHLWLGKAHRQLGHDETTNLMLGLMFGPKAYVQSIAHDLLDRSITKATYSPDRQVRTVARRLLKLAEKKH